MNIDQTPKTVKMPISELSIERLLKLIDKQMEINSILSDVLVRVRGAKPEESKDENKKSAPMNFLDALGKTIDELDNLNSKTRAMATELAEIF